MDGKRKVFDAGMEQCGYPRRCRADNICANTRLAPGDFVNAKVPRDSIDGPHGDSTAGR